MNEATKPTTENATGLETANGGTSSQQPEATAPSGQIVFPDAQALQAEIDKRLKDRLEREKRKADEAAARAAAEAEASALARNQEWQKLAEKRAAEKAELEKQLADLDPTRAKAERYEAALKARLETERKAIPAHILALLDKLDPVEQMEWIAANQTAIAVPTKAAAAGVPSTPTPTTPGQMTAAQQDEAAKEARRMYQNRF